MIILINLILHATILHPIIGPATISIPTTDASQNTELLIGVIDSHIHDHGDDGNVKATGLFVSVFNYLEWIENTVGVKLGGICKSNNV